MPSPRGYVPVLHDPVTDLVYAFGGFYTFGWDTEVFDIWQFDPRSRKWKLLPGDVRPTNPDWGAVDVQSRKVIFFQPFTPEIRTLAYDLRTGAWETMNPAVQPPPRWGTRMVYDSESDRVLLFGGAHLFTEELLRDLWAYDYESDTWTELTSPDGPAPHHFSGFVYVPTIDRTLLFGGIGGWDGTLRNETWLYDYNANAWTRIEALNPPSGRIYHMLAFEPKTNRVVMFGGVEDESNWPNEPVLGETWTFDVERGVWSQKRPKRSPDARAWHGMTSTNHDIVMFGGGPSRFAYQNDTWTYSSRSNRWRQVSKRADDDD